MLKKRAIIMAIPLLLVLILTSGSFASGMLSGTQEMGLDEQPDFAQVEVTESPPAWTVFGSYIGSAGEGSIFTITPDGDYPGDLVCQVTFANTPDLISVYKLLILEIQVIENGNGQVGTTEYLTLRKGSVDIEFEGGGSSYEVRIVGGTYITHRAGWDAGKASPMFLCQISQR